MKQRRWPLVLLVAAAAAAVGLFVTGAVPLPGSHAEQEGKKKSVKAPEPVAVTVAPVTPRAVQRQVFTVGTLYGFEEVTVTPKIEGTVTKLLHDVGDTVYPGEALLEIEETYYRLAVSEAERALELELSRIGLKRVPDAALEIDKIPIVAQAKAEESNARLRAQRARDLRSTNAVSQEVLENALSNHEIAMAKRDHAIIEAQAILAAAHHKHALLQTAKQKLEETRVRVPDPSKERFRHSKLDLAPTPLKDLAERKPQFVVAQRLVAEGEMVRAFPSVAVFRLVIDQPLKLVTMITERHIGVIKIGQTAQLQVEAYPNEIFEGTVARVNPVVDRVSRSFQVEILIPNLDRRLKVGGFCRLAIATHVDSQAPTVPEEALVAFAGVTKVFTVKDGKAHSVPVQPGVRIDVPGKKRTETWIEINAAGLDGPVVTSGHSKLADGTPVRIR